MTNRAPAKAAPLDFRNEKCSHGRILAICHEATCRDILALVSTEREVGGWPADPRYVRRRRTAAEEDWLANRGRLDEWRAQERSHAPPAEGMAGEGRRRLSEVFSDPLARYGARQYDALSAREDRVLEAYLDAPNDPFRQIALKAGCSEPIARKEFRKLLGRFVVGHGSPAPPGGWRPPGTLKVVTRSRRRRVYVCREDRIGAWRQQYWELLSSTEARAALKTASRGHILRESRERPMRSSPMRNLWAALAHATIQGEARRPTTLPGVTSREWRSNREWARRRVQAYRTLFGQREGGSLTLVKVLDALAKGCTPCKTCRTPLLRGCRLQGKAVTRARESCDDACKMQHARRRN